MQKKESFSFRSFPFLINLHQDLPDNYYEIKMHFVPDAAFAPSVLSYLFVSLFL